MSDVTLIRIIALLFSLAAWAALYRLAELLWR